MLEIRPATEADIIFIAENARAVDKKEIELASGMSLKESLLFSRSISSFCDVICVDGQPSILWGAAVGEQPDVASPWMVGTNSAGSTMRRNWRVALELRDRLFKDYRVLQNFTLAENTLHLRWLKHLGFRFGGTIQVQGHPFIEFSHVRSSCNPGSDGRCIGGGCGCPTL